MKLNRKGYMLIEIVIASVLAMSIAIYLLNLTYKFKNTNEDIHQSYFYMRDKLLITKNIMSDLERGTISVTSDSPTCINFNIHIKATGTTEQRQLIITEDDGIKKIQYGKLSTSGGFDTQDISYYEKELEQTLVVSNLNVSDSGAVSTITIPIKSIYDDNDYSIKIFANKTQP